ncbi:MAG: SUMF1/EgtB/PvdO family nonheme iron enzyme [Bacteroidota bacterium]
MKTHVSPLLLAGLFFCCFAATPNFSSKKSPLDKYMLPISEGVFMAPEEVSNIDFKEFLASFPADSKDQQRLSPVESAWQNLPNAYVDPMEKNYFSHPAFSMYPVVNISHEQAQAYCDWLTQVYNNQETRTYEQVRFRLPTLEEWELAARGGNADANFPWESNPKAAKGFFKQYKDVKGKYLANFKTIRQDAFYETEEGELTLVDPTKSPFNYSGDSFEFTSPAHVYPSNGFGMLNMAGNVAEMIETKGISKGGSWYHTAYFLNINHQKSYKGPQPWLGFRYVMEVIKA